ncbi:MAG: hypothetical protein GYB66_05585 [Chloroflexi bacterium]|nr:hypothetical protein [Chloroflexota bacterium]
MNDHLSPVPDEETTVIRNLKASLKRATFHEEIYPGHILLYRFDNLSREVLIQWVDYIRGKTDSLESPVRILYDFRNSGPPSRFLIDRLPAIMGELQFPENTRSAFLVDDDINGRFTRNALVSMPANIGKTQSFLNVTPALKWLKQEDVMEAESF